jgi:L-2-hydroxyglutarate oxidase
VHCTRMIDGTVHLGPNAVLAFRREGYRKMDFNAGEFLETVTFPGLWKLFGKHAASGVGEMVRSVSRRVFVRSVQRLVPSIGMEDVVPCEAGVRAQALGRSGELIDDFLVLEEPGMVHVCNAPSPAATASLEIGKAIADRVEGQEGWGR